MGIWHGCGANGKSKLQNMLLALLGDYGKSTPSDGLMARYSGRSGVGNDLARLQGARLAAAFETGGQARLNEGLIKQATGGDPLPCRFLYGELFEYVPQFKIVLSCNKKPKITGQDHGIWRRVHLVPFDETIPPQQQDKNLPEKLAAELPGILNWALVGCEQWQKHGLNPPREVTAATENYQAEMDSLGDFIDDCVEKDPDEKTGYDPMYRANKAWAEAAGEKSVSRRILIQLLKERGFVGRRSSPRPQRTWLVIWNPSVVRIRSTARHGDIFTKGGPTALGIFHISHRGKFDECVAKRQHMSREPLAETYKLVDRCDGLVQNES